MRGTSTPRVLDEARLHRVMRYIAGTLGVDWLFRWQGGVETLTLYDLADADHAADDESRRSESCSQEFSGLSLVGPRGWETDVRCYQFWRKRALCCETHPHEESS